MPMCVVISPKQDGGRLPCMLHEWHIITHLSYNQVDVMIRCASWSVPRYKSNKVWGGRGALLHSYGSPQPIPGF